MNRLERLKVVLTKLDKEVKGCHIEQLETDLTNNNYTLDEVIDLYINTWINLWIEEDKESTELYTNLKNELLSI